MIAIPGIVLTPTILIQAAAGSAAYLTWAVCAVLAFGIYNTASIGEADWIGLPATAWPGLDLGFEPAFWALLPAFVPGDRRRRDGYARRRHRHSARVVAQAARHRLPVGPGRHDRGRRGETCCRVRRARCRTLGARETPNSRRDRRNRRAASSTPPPRTAPAAVAPRPPPPASPRNHAAIVDLDSRTARDRARASDVTLAPACGAWTAARRTARAATRETPALESLDGFFGRESAGCRRASRCRPDRGRPPRRAAAPRSPGPARSLGRDARTGWRRRTTAEVYRRRSSALCAPSRPWSAAMRYHRAASNRSRRTP